MHAREDSLLAYMHFFSHIKLCSSGPGVTSDDNILKLLFYKFTWECVFGSSPHKGVDFALRAKVQERAPICIHRTVSLEI